MGLTYSATKLAMPKVTWEGNVAVWTEHSFATGYVYKIGENGEEIVATGNGVALTNGQTLYVKAVGDGVFYLDSEWRTVTYTAQKLVPPKPKTVEGVCSWTAVTGAVAYEYQIDGGQVQQTENTSVALSAYCTLKIRAIGDGEIYTSSDWYTYVYDAPTKLEVVGVHLNVATGVVAWDGKSVEGVEKYVYKIGADGAETDGGISGKVTLIEGEVVYIKAIGDGAEYLDSDWYALQYSKSGNGFEGYV